MANGTHFGGHHSFSVELFKVKKYLKTRIVLKIFESDSVTLGHRKLEKIMEKFMESHGI